MAATVEELKKLKEKLHTACLGAISFDKGLDKNIDLLFIKNINNDTLLKQQVQPFAKQTNKNNINLQLIKNDTGLLKIFCNYLVTNAANKKGFLKFQELSTKYQKLIKLKLFKVNEHLETFWPSRNGNIKNICQGITEYLDDPDIKDILITSIIKPKESTKTINKDLRRRSQHHESMLRTILENAKKLNKLEPNTIDADNIEQLDKTIKKISKFNAELNLIDSTYKLLKKIGNENKSDLKSQAGQNQAIKNICSTIESNQTYDTATLIEYEKLLKNILTETSKIPKTINQENIDQLKSTLDNISEEKLKKLGIDSIEKDEDKEIIKSLNKHYPIDKNKTKEEFNNIIKIIKDNPPKDIKTALEKHGFKNVTIEEAGAIKQDFYYSKLNSNIADAIKASGGGEIHAKRGQKRLKFRALVMGKKSLTLYIIDQINKLYNKGKNNQIKKHLQLLGISEKAANEVVEKINQIGQRRSAPAKTTSFKKAKEQIEDTKHRRYSSNAILGITQKLYNKDSKLNGLNKDIIKAIQSNNIKFDKSKIKHKNLFNKINIAYQNKYKDKLETHLKQLGLTAEHAKTVRVDLLRPKKKLPTQKQPSSTQTDTHPQP